MATTIAAATAAGGPPAMSSSSPSKKRPAETPVAPLMAAAAAKKTLSALKVPKSKASTQSQYVRFKAHLLKDAKARGDKETTENITKVAKEAWGKVKHLTPPPAVESGTNTNDVTSSSSSNLSEDVQRYLRIKGLMLKEEKEEVANFNAEAKAYCTAFVPSAAAHLQWAIIEATEENQQNLVEACKLVNAKLIPDLLISSGVKATSVNQALSEAKNQLKHFKGLNDERVLFTKLQNATEEELKQHVKEHCRLLAQDAEYNTLKRNKEAEEQRKRVADELALSSAWEIEGKVTRALEKQMKYSDLKNKYSSSKISFTKGGVSQKVFAKAFNVPVGTKTATIAAHKVGEKWLRYGASLKCNDVTVKLVGDELVAQTSFYMSK